jgi:hypothetical protein
MKAQKSQLYKTQKASLPACYNKKYTIVKFRQLIRNHIPEG